MPLGSARTAGRSRGGGFACQMVQPLKPRGLLVRCDPVTGEKLPRLIGILPGFRAAARGKGQFGAFLKYQSQTKALRSDFHCQPLQLIQRFGVAAQKPQHFGAVHTGHAAFVFAAKAAP